MVIAVVLFFRKGLKGFFSLRYVTILFFIIKLLNLFSSGRRLQSRGLLIDNQSWKLDFFILLLNQFYISMHYYGNKIYIFTLFNADFFIIKKGLSDFFFTLEGGK